MYPMSSHIFPSSLAYSMVGGPQFSTTISTSRNGREQRNRNWSQARCRYNIAPAIASLEKLEGLLRFFRQHYGRALGFRFEDLFDNKGIGEILGTGDGLRTDFPLIKHYGSSVIRPIQTPRCEEVIIMANAVIQAKSTYECGPLTGIITFKTPPAAGVIITANYGFYVPVRFDIDHIEARLDSYNSYSWSPIPLVEVRL